ncbi:hypothetical protein G6F56_013436 [Rhizopus delemar]|nr:hypothetical protein G6F56_013436 [Rhizopus delemar]
MDSALPLVCLTAGTHCCAVTKVVSTEDANAVLDMVKGLVPDIEASLSAIVNKKSEFAKVTAAPTIVKADIKSLQGNVVALDTCIVAVTPAEFNTVATGYVTRVNAAFDAANAAYA